MEISINEWRMLVPTLDKDKQWKKIENNEKFFSMFKKAIEVLNWSKAFRNRYNNDSGIEKIMDISKSKEDKKDKKDNYIPITIDDCLFFSVWIAMNYTKTFSDLIVENQSVSEPVLKDEAILASQKEYIENNKNRVMHEDKQGSNIMGKRKKLMDHLMDQSDDVFECYDDLIKNVEEDKEFLFFLDGVATHNIYNINPRGRDLEKILTSLKKVKKSINSNCKEEVSEVLQEIIYPDVSIVHLESIAKEVKKLFKEKFPESKFLQQNLNIQIRNKKEFSNTDKKDQYELLDSLTFTYNKIFEV
ncbi:MAG: hypothetical protein SOZ13_01865 [Enterococcus avium]|jgi:hypothetical protein|uniref:hypothetical protein n=1 Tax=Enterococcus avium TaxID=33945 RepID=UPI002A87D3CA|nr:hypothetical protein [Enterococcus avium]